MKDITDIKTQLENGANPRDIKLQLAYEIVKMYHKQEEAEKARDSWVSEVSNKQTAADLKTVELSADTDMAQILIDLGIVDSKSKARRLFDEGAVRINDVKVTLENCQSMIVDAGIFMVGKKHKFLIKKV